MNPIYEINRLADQLPLPVVQDLHQRMADWLANGGNFDDPYMFRQLRYAQNVAERMGQDGSGKNRADNFDSGR